MARGRGSATAPARSDTRVARVRVCASPSSLTYTEICLPCGRCWLRSIGTRSTRSWSRATSWAVRWSAKRSSCYRHGQSQRDGLVETVRRRLLSTMVRRSPTTLPDGRRRGARKRSAKAGVTSLPRGRSALALTMCVFATAHRAATMRSSPGSHRMRCSLTRSPARPSRSSWADTPINSSFEGCASGSTNWANAGERRDAV